MIQLHQAEVQPWWKFGYVWLIIAGPATVVVAAFVTFYLAYSGIDQVVDEDYYRKGIEINKTLGEKQVGLTPALDARNHVATPEGVPAKAKP